MVFAQGARGPLAIDFLSFMKPAIEGDLRLAAAWGLPSRAPPSSAAVKRLRAWFAKLSGMPIGNAGYSLGQYGFTARRGKTFVRVVFGALPVVVLIRLFRDKGSILLGQSPGERRSTGGLNGCHPLNVTAATGHEEQSHEAGKFGETS